MNLTITPMNTYAQKRSNVTFEAFRTTPEAAKTITLLKNEIVLDLGNEKAILEYLPRQLRKSANQIAKKYKGYFLTESDYSDLYTNSMKPYSRPMRKLDEIVANSTNVNPKSVEKIAQDFVTELSDTTTKAYGDVVFDEKIANGLESMNESFKAIREKAIEALKILGA